MALPGISRWENRVALVTGAGAGIGAFVSKELVKYGMIVVGCARNVAPIDDLVKECISLGYKGKLHAAKCDLTKEEDIERMFAWIKTNLGGVDVCINNAGFTTITSILEVKAIEMREMVDTNVVALVLCSNLSIASMRERGVDDGHIINVNSILGHTTMGVMTFYSGTKYAVTAISEGMRKELAAKGSKIKISQISPGRVETNFLQRALGDAESAKKIYASAKALSPEDVSNAILHALSSPEHVQIYDILLQPMISSSAATYSSATKK